jgi:hypothetical protein
MIALAFLGREGAFAARVVKAETTFNGLIWVLAFRALSFTVFLDLTDEGFEIEESVAVGDRRFPVAEALDGTAAFFRFFLDGFIEGGVGSVTVSRKLRVH